MFSHQSRQQHLICMMEISISERTRTENVYFFFCNLQFFFDTSLSNKGHRKVADGTKEKNV